jgi:alpha-L-rhamnosidase
MLWDKRMLRRRDVLLCAGGAAVTGSAIGHAARRAATSDGPTGLMVDLRQQPAGVAPEAARFSWLAPRSAKGAQSAFQIQAAASRDHLLAGRPDYDSGRVTGAASASIALPAAIVQPGQHIYWRVRTWDEAGGSGWSRPQRIIGAAPAAWDADPIWISEGDRPTDWLLARTEFDVPHDVTAVWVHATAASPEPARQFVFRMMLNGAFVGAGPVRSHAPQEEVRYATFDLTDRVRPGRNALAALCYAAEGRIFLARITIVRGNGQRIVIGTGPAWRVLAGDHWRRPADFTGGGWYKAPQEFIDARHEPVGWELPGFDDRGWATPEKRPLAQTLIPQRVDAMVTRIVRPSAVQLSPGRWLFDLGREIAGGVRLSVTGAGGQTIELRLGEERSEDGGARYQLRASQTYREIWTLRDGRQQLEHWGYRAFRWIELIADPALDLRESVVGVQLAMPWNDGDSAFASSNADLDRVWAMCRYSIAATRLDLYQDTPSRERGAYEGDAIVNQLSEQAVQRSYALARYSTGYLARRPTWPTEYRMQTPILAWRDYMATGDIGVLTENYEAMRARMRLDRLNGDGLVEKDPGGPSIAEGDLVDWPIANRDDFAFTRVNAVVNMWQYAALVAMARIARATGPADDARRFASLAATLRDRINAAFLGADGTYIDGIGTSHRSQHATAFAVALGVVPQSHLAAAGRALAMQGMHMSVYGAQFLLEALYRAGQPNAAMALMTSRARFSWLHMIDDLHATITTEAWDPAVKPNMTFSHAWGTAPANIVQRYVAGVEIVTPGAGRLRITPQPSGLSHFRATVPTIRGAVRIAYDGADRARLLEIRLPANVAADIALTPPLIGARDPTRLHVSGGSRTRATAEGGFVIQAGCGARISVAG